MQSSDCERAMSIQPTAMATSPHPGVGLYPMGVLSPLARMDTASLLGRESSVVWVHSSSAGCSWDREEPGCCFWVTCQVLSGTIKMLTGSCNGTRTEPLEGH